MAQISIQLTTAPKSPRSKLGATRGTVALNIHRNGGEYVEIILTDHRDNYFLDCLTVGIRTVLFVHGILPDGTVQCRQSDKRPRMHAQVR